MLEAMYGHQQLVQIYYFIGEVLPLIAANLRGLNLAVSAGGRTPAVQAQTYANMGISCGLLGMHRRAQMYHPDKLANVGPDVVAIANQMMKDINAGYETLTRSVA